MEAIFSNKKSKIVEKISRTQAQRRIQAKAQRLNPAKSVKSAKRK